MECKRDIHYSGGDLMQCKDCLIWRNRRDDLAQQATEMVDYCCAMGFEKIVDGVATSTDRAFREHIKLMDTECPNGRCIVNQGENYG